MIQDTSIKAYDRVKYSNWCEYEEEMILKMVAGTGACGRDMAKTLKVEAFALRPRITELKKAGKIMDSGERKSFHYIDRNGKSQVSREILWRITPKSFQSGFLF